jgi:hypothetical protein
MIIKKENYYIMCFGAWKPPRGERLSLKRFLVIDRRIVKKDSFFEKDFYFEKRFFFIFMQKCTIREACVVLETN